MKTNPNKFQLYNVTLQESGGLIGQLVFNGNDSDTVVGLIVDAKESSNDVTIMLFEPKDGPIPSFVKEVLAESLSYQEIGEYMEKCEKTWPGYINWFFNMNPEDWRIGCPIGES